MGLPGSPRTEDDGKENGIASSATDSSARLNAVVPASSASKVWARLLTDGVCVRAAYASSVNSTFWTNKCQLWNQRFVDRSRLHRLHNL